MQFSEPEHPQRSLDLFAVGMLSEISAQDLNFEARCGKHGQLYAVGGDYEQLMAPTWQPWVEKI